MQKINKTIVGRLACHRYVFGIGSLLESLKDFSRVFWSVKDDGLLCRRKKKKLWRVRNLNWIFQSKLSY